MPRFAIVVADTAKTQAFHARSGARLSPADAGAVHTVMDSECPNGLPNCRNCGDPEHAESCAKAGHCPFCGTRHGIAPDRVLAANGFALEPQ